MVVVCPWPSMARSRLWLALGSVCCCFVVLTLSNASSFRSRRSAPNPVGVMGVKQNPGLSDRQRNLEELEQRLDAKLRELEQGRVDEVAQEKRMAESEGRIRRLEWRQDRVLKSIEPWERCLRFDFDRSCSSTEVRGDEEKPCMEHVLRDMGIALTDALERANVDHWVSYGTLLGAVRGEKVLPWTADVDVVIPSEAYGSMGKKLASDGTLKNRGYLFFYDKKYPDIARACVTRAAGKRFTDFEILDAEQANYYDKYPYIDIYKTKTATTEARQGKGVVQVVWGPPCTFAAKTVFPLQKIPFYSKKVWAPANTTQYLSQLYGPGFMTPPPANLRTGHGFYVNSCKKEWQP